MGPEKWQADCCTAVKRGEVPPLSQLETALRVLAVASAKNAAFFNGLLPTEHFMPVQFVTSAAAARRILLEQPVDILIVNAPVSDEFGVELAEEAVRRVSCGVLLVVSAEVYDQTVHRLWNTGILCLARPCPAQLMVQAAQLLAVNGQRMQRLVQRSESLQTKMEEIRLVNRAKWLLIQHGGMEEAQAHRAIEKRAMDARITRGALARQIIEEYADKDSGKG